MKKFSPEQQELIAELTAKKIKFSIDEIIDIQRLENGKIIFLEQGNQSAGLQHILSHIADFTKCGILPNEIADTVMTAVTQGNIVAYQRKRPIYEFSYNGKKQLMAVTVSDNGFIVGANPASFK